MPRSSKPILPIRLSTFAICIAGTIISGIVQWMGVTDWPLLVIFGFLTLVGIYDILQTKHAILRNYPILGHMRFLLEFIRPEIRQYFIEGDNDKTPFSREQRT
jgi:glutamate synthase domain-containing protein 2